MRANKPIVIPLTPPMSPDRPARAARSPLRTWLLALALLYPVLYVAIAVMRMSFPFELEWIEGMVLVEVQRLLAGQPLYVAPSLDYVPLNYAPLYFWVSAAAAQLFGADFFALRLVSFLSSLGCFRLVFVLVRRETGDRVAALLAVCLFAACYRIGGAWYDVARADSLYLMLLLAAVEALRRFAGGRAAFAAGVLLGLAFLAKQSALAVAAPLLLYMGFRERTRLLPFAGGFLVTGGGGWAWLHAASQGWFTYYAFQVAASHRPRLDLLVSFLTQDLVGKLSIAMLIAAIPFVLPAPGPERAKGRGLLAAAMGGMVASAWAVRGFPGGYDNVLVPAHAAIGVRFGIGFGELSPRAARAQAGAAIARFATLAVMIQFLALAYDPRRQLPTAEDRAAGERLLQGLRETSGPVLIPCHSYLAARAGKPIQLHEMPFMDVVKGGTGPVETRLLEELRQAMREKRWALLVLDSRDWLEEEARPHYEIRGQVSAGPEVLWPVTGMRTRPVFVLGPRSN